MDPAGAVNVCARSESPLVGLVEPSLAHEVPPWQPEFTAVTEGPVATQPASPDSKPPLVMPDGGGPPNPLATSSQRVKLGPAAEMAAGPSSRGGYVGPARTASRAPDPAAVVAQKPAAGVHGARV